MENRRAIRGEEMGVYLIKTYECMKLSTTKIFHFKKSLSLCGA